MRTTALLGLTLFLSVLVGCGDDSSTSAGTNRVDDIEKLQGNASEGQKRFDSTCGSASCHGPDGKAGPAPDFPQVVPGRSTRDLASVVVNGTGRMPRQSSLSDQDVADVIAYLKATF